MVNKKIIVPVVGATVLVGGIATYFYLNRGAGGGATPAAIATVLPDEANMAIFISTEEQDWNKLKQFGTLEAQQAFTKSFQEFQQKTLAESNVDLEKDLKPWVGNMMVAVMPGADAKEPEVLMAIAIKDKIGALNFANRLKNNPKIKHKETDFKGVKITETLEEKAKKPYYTAVLKDSYLMMASDRKSIENSIETIQGSPSFATKFADPALLSQPVGNNEATLAHVYLPDYAGLAQSFATQTKQPMSAATLAQLKQVKSAIATVSIDQVGLRFKGKVVMDPNATIAFNPAPGKVVSQFPPDTFALFSGANLSSYWNQFTTQAKDNRETKQLVDMMRGTTQMVGLDLDTDIFGWMNGEFAVGMVPLNEGMMASLGFGQAMVFTTSDRKTAEATLGKLDAIAKSQSMQIAKRDVNGVPITHWQTPQGALLGHGWLNDNTLLIAVGEPLITTFSNQSDPSLETSDNFKLVTNALPKQNLGYFYMDMEKTMGFMNKVTPVSQKSSVKPESTAILNSIKSIGGTTSQVDKTTSQFEVVFALKPAK